MTPFKARRRGGITATFDPAEANVIANLASQVVELLRDRNGERVADTDPLVSELGLGGPNFGFVVLFIVLIGFVVLAPSRRSKANNSDHQECNRTHNRLRASCCKARDGGPRTVASTYKMRGIYRLLQVCG